MPYVTIKTGFKTPNGEEETLTEYLCDFPDCGKIAVHVVGCAREISAAVVLCDEHAPGNSRSHRLPAR